MTIALPRSFAAQLKTLRETAGYTQEELATIAGLSVHAVSALERGQRRRPQFETVRALSAALDLTGAARDAFAASARTPDDHPASGQAGGVALPLSPTALLGRDADVRALRSWLAADAANRLITITGPGGVGKTRVALELARDLAATGSVRVQFVPLAATRDPAVVASAIAEALGLSDVAVADLPEHVRAACHDRPTLMLLDNLEQVVNVAPLVATLLSAAPAIRLLATSRSPLRVRGEREYVLSPLPVEVDLEGMSLADLAQSPSVRLFVERVRDVQPDFRLTSANGPTVAAICRRLDGLPLALELAAPWMKVLSAENLLSRLSDDVLHSTPGAPDLPERQQTINATVAWSYQLLDGDAQRAFRRFGALPGLFPLDAGEEVLADREADRGGSDAALQATASLMDKSLLVRADTSAVTACSLYYMLDTVRAYAGRELAASGEREAAMEGLVRYVRSEATLAAEGLIGPAQVKWLNRTREDLDSYRGALAWLVENGRAVEAAHIASVLMTFWAIRGRASEGLWWYEQILSLPDVPPAAESKVCNGIALMCYTRGDLARARAAVERALPLARSIGDRGQVALAENLLGHVELGVGNVNAARSLFASCVETFQDLAIPWGASNARTGLAAVALATGDTAQAERLIAKALPTLRSGGPLYLSFALIVRARLAVRRGNAEEALAAMGESLTCIRELQDEFSLVHALVPLAAAAVLSGDDLWAARILGARDAAGKRVGATLADRSLDGLTELAEGGVRARLGPERWAHAFAVGSAASIDTLLLDIEVARQRAPMPTGLR